MDVEISQDALGELHMLDADRADDRRALDLAARHLDQVVEGFAALLVSTAVDVRFVASGSPSETTLLERVAAAHVELDSAWSEIKSVVRDVVDARRRAGLL